MDNALLNLDITPDHEGINPNIYSAYENQMHMPAAMPNVAGSKAVNYPEIYYKLQPHIVMVCDQLDNYGIIPTKEIMENAADNIHEDVLKMHPEMAEYVNANEMKVNEEMPEARETIFSGIGSGFGFGFGDGRFGHPRFRRRGFLTDLIDILLLSEFQRRRRRRFPF